MHRYDLAKTLIIYIEIPIRRLEETVNYKLLMARAKKPKIYTECSVSLMTSAEKRQPPPNDLEE